MESMLKYPFGVGQPSRRKEGKGEMYEPDEKIVAFVGGALVFIGLFFHLHLHENTSPTDVGG
jgi:hypothetical protein